MKNLLMVFTMILALTCLVGPTQLLAEKAEPETDLSVTTLTKDVLLAQEAENNLLLKNKAQKIVAYWKDDFVFSTPDEEFMMKIRGNIHFDTKFYNEESNNPTQFDIRRARIDFQGVFYRYASFRVQVELADSPYVRNAWVDFKIHDAFHLRAGQMKPPFSTSWWTLDNNVNFFERGASTPLYPYFDRGWWIWGELFSKTVTWNLAAFTGVGMDYDNNKGDIDDQKDIIGRFFVAPFINLDVPALKNFYLCYQMTYGPQSIPTDRFETRGYGAVIRDSKFWTWETEKIGHGEIERRDRWGAEIHYINGPFSLSSEYLVCHYENIAVYASDDVPILSRDGDITSWSSWVSFFVTGETKSVSNAGWRQPKPKANFNPSMKEGPGAWEVLLRYTRTETAPELFDTVEYMSEKYAILKGSDSVDEYTVGLCWTWNLMIRWMLNYTRLQTDPDAPGIRTGDSTTLEGTKWVEQEDMIALRLIFKI